MDFKDCKKYLTLFNILLVIGMLISLFLVYEHFSTTSSTLCKIGEGFDCGIVNKSPYANADGIFFLLVIEKGWTWLPYINLSSMNVFFDLLTSNAFLGFLTLLFLLFLNISNKKDDFLFIPSDKKDVWVKSITGFGVLYAGFLFYIQHSVLKTYCIYCLGLDVVLVSIAILAFTGYRK